MVVSVNVRSAGVVVFAGLAVLKPNYRRLARTY